MDPASIVFAALAEEYRKAGRIDEAIETCRAGLERHPSYLSARVTLGRALIEKGDFREARTHLEQVVRQAPENLAAIRALAEIHHRGGNSGEEDGVSPGDMSDSFDVARASAGLGTSLPAATAVVHTPDRDSTALHQIEALERFLDSVRSARGT